MIDAVEFKAVGLTFVDDYPANVDRVAEMVDAAKVATLGWSSAADASGVEVVLIRDLDNEYDPNAIEVHVPALGRHRSRIGHVPRELAERIAPSLDRGDEWDARVASVLVQPEHPDRPGVEITAERITA